jgi:hypothetical protein
VTPLAGFVLGRRLVGSSAAGAGFALALAWLGPATRALVGGSNDFVLALPLVLLLAAHATAWAGKEPPALWDAVGFGLLVGYAAVVNVVGAEWLLPALVVLAAVSRPAFGGRVLAWIVRWTVALTAALAAGAPSLYVLVSARFAPSSLTGALSAPASTPVGIGLSQFVGSIDPFLFRAGDIELSPIPLVRIELAVLLVLGAVALLWLAIERPREDRFARFDRWTVAVGVSIVAWLGIQLGAGVPGSPLRVFAFVSSAAEFSLGLFTVYGLIAAVPLVLALEQLPAPGRAGSRRAAGRGHAPPRGLGRAFAPVALAVIVIVPAVVLTPTSLGQVLSNTYADFGNVSAADFQLLDYASDHVPAGTRVLVAPGSAGEFLPGYAPGIVLLYPMAPGWSRVNASYLLVVQELTNGTLDGSGRAALASLEVDLVVVTGNNTVLWRAFWASALLGPGGPSSPTFPFDFHDQDAWIFNVSACRLPPGSCP